MKPFFSYFFTFFLLLYTTDFTVTFNAVNELLYNRKLCPANIDRMPYNCEVAPNCCAARCGSSWGMSLDQRMSRIYMSYPSLTRALSSANYISSADTGHILLNLF